MNKLLKNKYLSNLLYWILGTEINLLKLRNECMKLKEAKEDEIYILFIDFSCVYDNVQHEILRIINLIKKVYSYAIITIDPIMKSIIR